MKLETDTPLVSIRELSFSRGSRPIFENIHLDVARGKVTAIMGPSGCGKTTLLRFIGGQLYPDKGQVLVNGENVPEMSRRELFVARAKMGMLFQSGALFSDLSVYENVAFPLRAHTQLSESLIHELVLMKLEAVGLRGAWNLMPAELSGGMQQRVGIARAVGVLDLVERVGLAAAHGRARGEVDGDARRAGLVVVGDLVGAGAAIDIVVTAAGLEHVVLADRQHVDRRALELDADLAERARCDEIGRAHV